MRALLSLVIVLLLTGRLLAIDQARLLDAIKRDAKEEAVQIARQAADKGEAEGYGALGEFAYQGYGMPVDMEAARTHYRRAADRGNAVCAYRLACMCRKGEGGPRDMAAAAEWYQQAVLLGNSNACHDLAIMYTRGLGVEQDEAKAMELHTKAAEGGNAGSQYFLGESYLRGIGVPPDFIKARKWLTKSAEAGEANAQHSLGLLYEEGLGVEASYEDALNWFEKAAAQGNSEARLGIGRCLLFVRDGRGNYARALELLLPAAKAGNLDAKYHVGVAYHMAGRGDNIKPDMKEGLKWKKEAALGGHAKACCSLGIMSESGPEGQRNYREAASWYERGVALGNAECMNNLGYLLHTGNGVPRDDVKARSLFEAAAQRGDPRGAANIGDMYADAKDWGWALAWYGKAVDNGNDATALFLGDLFNFNDEGTRWTNSENKHARWDDRAQAISWYERGANLGNLECMRYLARLLYLNREYNRARLWFSLLKNRNFLSNADLSSYAYCLEHLNQGRDAARVYEALADSGCYGDAFYKRKLAEMYNEGKVVPRDPERARRYAEGANLTDTWNQLAAEAKEKARQKREEELRHPQSTWDSTQGPIAPCPICGGTGMHDGVTCKTCGGKGKVRVEK